MGDVVSMLPWRLRKSLALIEREHGPATWRGGPLPTARCTACGEEAVVASMRDGKCKKCKDLEAFF